MGTSSPHTCGWEATSLRVGAITPFTTVDWPGHLACVVWLAGCPWRCPYCQNHLLRDDAPGVVTSSWEELVSLLEGRRGLLDGVVFSGGEPLMQPGIVDAVRRVRALGFEVALHTCGALPERLREVLPYLSWVGFDVKAPWEGYDRVTRVPGSGARARASLRSLVESGVPMEVRTTWHPSLISADDVRAVGSIVRDEGASHWAVQAYRPDGTDGTLPDITVYPSDLPEDVPTLVPSFEFRRA